VIFFHRSPAFGIQLQVGEMHLEGLQTNHRWHAPSPAVDFWAPQTLANSLPSLALAANTFMSQAETPSIQVGSLGEPCDRHVHHA
jgi:hypothetical protein